MYNTKSTSMKTLDRCAVKSTVDHFCQDQPETYYHFDYSAVHNSVRHRRDDTFQVSNKNCLAADFDVLDCYLRIKSSSVSKSMCNVKQEMTMDTYFQPISKDKGQIFSFEEQDSLTHVSFIDEIVYTECQPKGPSPFNEENLDVRCFSEGPGSSCDQDKVHHVHEQEDVDENKTFQHKKELEMIPYFWDFLCRVSAGVKQVKSCFLLYFFQHLVSSHLYGHHLLNNWESITQTMTSRSNEKSTLVDMKTDGGKGVNTKKSLLSGFQQMTALILILTLIVKEVSSCNQTLSGEMKATTHGKDILLQFFTNASEENTKWEGGPKHVMLTFNELNNSNISNFQAIKRGKTYDLLIIEPSEEEFKAFYTIWIQFGCFRVFLPDLSIQPGNQNIHVSQDIKDGLLEFGIVLDAIYPKPDFQGSIGGKNVTQQIKVNISMTGFFYDCQLKMTHEIDRSVCNKPLQISYFVHGAAVLAVNKNIDGKFCKHKVTEQTGSAIGVTVAVVILLMLIIAFVYCKRRGRCSGRKNGEDNIDPDESGNKLV